MARRTTESWRWILWDVLVRARNPRGAQHYAKAKMIAHGWMTAEQTCPRRMGEFGPWEHQQNIDWWRRGSWGWGWLRRFRYWWRNGPIGAAANRFSNWTYAQWCTAEFPDGWRKRLRLLGNRFNWGYGGTVWEWPWQPRTCSFCGGVNPEDAIRLINEGWTCEGTTKSYKRYLEPPPIAYKTFEEAYPRLFSNFCKPHQRESRGERVPVRAWGAVHPVKLYVAHFTSKQVEAFNAALAAALERERQAALKKALNA